jgi:hypothetical protein
VSQIKKFESDLYLTLDEEKTILESLRDKKDLSEEAETKLKDLL